MKSASKILTPLIAISLAGCAQLPLDGPSHRDIDRGALVQFVVDRNTVAYDYALVDVTPGLIDSLAGTGGQTLRSLGSTVRRSAPVTQIGVGDVLQITIFESAAGGLFLPEESGSRLANSVTMPSQSVSAAGDVSVPYAGRIHMAGRSISEIERDIQKKLADRAIEPQVIVALLQQNSASVSVIGDTLNSANTFKIGATGERVLDMISHAGGTRFPGYELYVTLVRKDNRATISFSQLVNDPGENVYVMPGDTIHVFRQQQTYIAVGALGSSGQSSGVTGQFPFDQDKLSLNEALAKAGGLLDTRADPGMVFLYRMEHRSVLEKSGVDLTCFPADQTTIPTVYRLNFRDPSSFFIAQRLMMRNQDVIYAANADAVEMKKFFDHARAITSTVAGVATDISVVSSILKGNASGSSVSTN